MTAESDTADAPICQRFSAPDADVTIRSSDGVLFKMHRRNLELYSDAFPGDSIPTRGEIVDLEENSETLELLFQYMYRQPQPDLFNVPFDTLRNLAEASEKYRVYSAIEVCKAYMRMEITRHPMAVLAYAARHGYSVLCDEAAPLSIGHSVIDASYTLDPGGYVVWVVYREQWIKCWVTAFNESRLQLSHPEGGSYRTGCSLWLKYRMDVVRELTEDIHLLRSLDKLFSKTGKWKNLADSCKPCGQQAAAWESEVASRVATVKSFSTVQSELRK